MATDVYPNANAVVCRDSTGAADFTSINFPSQREYMFGVGNDGILRMFK